jgi:hypothetical protein
MLKHSRENRRVAWLVRWMCHGRAGPNHYALKVGGGFCGESQSRSGTSAKAAAVIMADPRDYGIRLIYVMP